MTPRGIYQIERAPFSALATVYRTHSISNFIEKIAQSVYLRNGLELANLFWTCIG